VSAFLKEGDEVGTAIQRAVAARFLLVATLENSKRTKEKADLAPFLQSARDESANLEAQKASAEKAGRTALAEALSFTHRQLLAIIIHVERVSR
jgi:hypothetical protein